MLGLVIEEIGAAGATEVLVEAAGAVLWEILDDAELVTACGVS